MRLGSNFVIETDCPGLVGTADNNHNVDRSSRPPYKCKNCTEAERHHVRTFVQVSVSPRRRPSIYSFKRAATTCPCRWSLWRPGARRRNWTRWSYLDTRWGGTVHTHSTCTWAWCQQCVDMCIFASCDGGCRYMSACYTLKYPERVSHLVLASPAGGCCPWISA